VLASMGRSFGGFAFAVATGISPGLLLGWHALLERYLGPLLQFLLRSIPSHCCRLSSLVLASDISPKSR
jgi:ABC-type nitrate/sulfonate/bicarbonate transport system permease component